MHLSEKTIAVEEIYNGKILRVTRDKALLENGREAVREVIHHSGGVCVLPLTDDNEVLLVKQFRYPFQTTLLEVPAGKREAGEDPLTCGVRELKEEVGATAAQITPLGCLYPTVAYDTEVIYMYLARGLDFGAQKLDEGEFLDVVKVPFAEAYRMAMEGELPDAKTQLAVLKAWLMMQNQ